MTPKEIKQLSDVLVIHASKACRDRYHQAPAVFGETLKALCKMTVAVESAMTLCETLAKLEAHNKRNQKIVQDAYEQTDAQSYLGEFSV